MPGTRRINGCALSGFSVLQIRVRELKSKSVEVNLISNITVFQRNTIFDKFPFLLPNVVCVVVLILGIIVGFLFLEETHPEKKLRRDHGLELGHWLVAKFWGSHVEVPQDKKDDADDYFDVPPPKYRGKEFSPRLGPVVSDDDDIEGQVKAQQEAPKTFTKQVFFNIIAYGILA